MTRTYESMFLIDNDAVRAGWTGAKASVAVLIEKHGGKVLTSRRWDERRLAYPIRHRRRATYLLAYCEIAPERLVGLRRELDISETVLRYLITSVDAVPPKEVELDAAERAQGFTVPEPPDDDHVEIEPAFERAESPRSAEPARASEDEGTGSEEAEEAEDTGAMERAREDEIPAAERAAVGASSETKED